MDMFSLFVLGASWILAGFVNGVTSFGGNLIGTPLTALVLHPQAAIICGNIVTMALSGTVMLRYFRHLPKKEFALIMTTYIIGTPIGVAILHVAPISILLNLAATSIVLFLALQFFSSKLHFSMQAPAWVLIPAGLLSGIFLGSTSMGGPVVVMASILRRWKKEAVLATVNTTATVAAFVACIVMWQNGMLASDLIAPALCSAPCAAIGVLLSFPVVNRINTVLFKKMVLAMLVLAAMALFARALNVPA